jgi:DHA2 family multidrug resistance protein
MVPISQSILADSFPPSKRSQAFALFGVAVVVAPVVGPTLGGYLSDNFSWHWCFLINGPVGLFAFILVYFLVDEPDSLRQERARMRRQGVRFDIVGFLLVATFLGALELVLDRGQTEDWFGSNFIIAATAICIAAFLLAIPWLMKTANPVVDLRLLAGRQFGSCFIVMLATGAILIATTQFIPQVLQQNFGYTATWAGLALSPGGLVTMFMMFVAGRISNKFQPKYLITIGTAIIAAAMYDMTRLNADLNFGFFVWSRIYLGLGLPLIFIPMTAASYDGLRPDQTDRHRPSSMQRETLVVRSALRSPQTCSPTGNSGIRAGWSSTSSPPIPPTTTPCRARPSILPIEELERSMPNRRLWPGSASRCRSRRSISPISTFSTH